MQQTKLFPGFAILTFHIHKLWRSFLRIVTSKDEEPFLMTPIILCGKMLYSLFIWNHFKVWSIFKGAKFHKRISIFNYELVYIMSVNFLDINDMQNKQKIFYKLN